MRVSAMMCFMVATIMASSTGAWANGYKILGVKDAEATAMGEAFAAQADNPSAVAINPAGLPKVRGNQVSVQATLLESYIEHTAPDGAETDNKDRWQVVPSLFITSDLGAHDLTAGFGATLPNGLSSEWGEDSFARYVSTYSALTVADIGPALGVRVTDALSVGAGVSFYYSEARLERMVDFGLAFGASGAMDARAKLEGDGTAWGGRLGALYAINGRHSVALVYHLPFRVDYDGDYTIEGAGTSDVEASIDFPASVVAGYAFTPAPPWTVEFDVDWTDWNSVDDISVHFDTPMLGATDATQAQELHNTLAYKLGVEYRPSDTLALRVGYIYNENATDEATWRPSMPDTDVHFLTGGFGYRWGRLTLDTAIQLVFYTKRTIDNNVDMNETFSGSSIDGTYETFAPCASLAATYRF